MKQKIIIAIVSFIVGFAVYDLFVVDWHIATREPIQIKEESSIEYLKCPSVGNFNDYWNTWSYEYITKYPMSDVQVQMDAWNTMMSENGCSEEWLNPLDDVIQQHGASGTPVYWYEEAN